MTRSPLGIDAQFIGDDKGVQRMLTLLDTALNPVAIAGFLGAEISPYIAGRAKARFDGEGDDVSGRWAPLSVNTQRIRESGRNQGLWDVGDAHPINVRTHELERYITSGIGDVIPSADGAILRYPNSTGITRGLKEKIKTAQQGRTDPRTPRRPVLGMNERDMSFILLALALHVKNTARGLPA